LTKFSLYIQLDAETGKFRDVLPSQSLSMVLKKLNLTQQKQTYINKPKDIIIQK